MINLLAQLDTATLAHSAEDLAGKSDRTLMVILMMIMIASGIYIVRFLAIRNDKLTEKLEEIARECNKGNMEVAQCLSKVSERLDAHTHAIQQIAGRMQ